MLNIEPITMTNEEAIERSKLIVMDKHFWSLENQTALNMVIKAAEQLYSIKEIMDASSYKENGVVYSYCYDPATRLRHIVQVLNEESGGESNG